MKPDIERPMLLCFIWDATRSNHGASKMTVSCGSVDQIKSVIDSFFAGAYVGGAHLMQIESLNAFEQVIEGSVYEQCHFSSRARELRIFIHQQPKEK